MGAQHSITHLLQAHRRGDTDASDALFARIYHELKAIAHRQLGRKRRSATVNTTALVHEAYLKMADYAPHTWADKAHFLAVAVTAMRHILVDYARWQEAAKRGGHAHHTQLDASALFAENTAIEMLDLDIALTRLATTDPRPGQAMELRFFGGLSIREIAEVLDVSERTVRRDLFAATSFLRLALHPYDVNGEAD
jgi:RNA polymerase sigma factor (TIGR02999 family)